MENFCYHGIDENLLRYESIMNTGIVSQALGSEIDGFEINSLGHFNGRNRVSVVIPHDADDDFYSALKVYILDGGISFYIKGVDYIPSISTDNYSSFPDEGFVNLKIPKNNIAGIVVNSNIRSKQIRDLSVIGNPGTGSVIPIVQSTVSVLKKSGIDISQNLISLEDEFRELYSSSSLEFESKLQRMNQTTHQMDAILAQAVELYYKKKLSKENINVMDVIDYYNVGKLPIYDENDVKNQCKGCELILPVIDDYMIFPTQVIGKATINVPTEDKALMDGIISSNSRTLSSPDLEKKEQEVEL